jgi:hypothetical protein
MNRPVSIDGAAVLAGFAVYLPVPGLRGALFALFPGIAYRDKSLILKGLLLGFVLDVVYEICWGILPLVWEPRAEYNHLLTDYLPPEHLVITHCGCAVPDVVQFTLGLVGWATAFFLLWLALWPRRLHLAAYFAIPCLGALLTAVAAIVLWNLAPLDEWWVYRSAYSQERIPVEVFVFVFILVVPLCTLAVGLLFWLGGRRRGGITGVPHEPKK